MSWVCCWYVVGSLIQPLSFFFSSFVPRPRPHLHTYTYFSKHMFSPLFILSTWACLRDTFIHIRQLQRSNNFARLLGAHKWYTSFQRKMFRAFVWVCFFFFLLAPQYQLVEKSKTSSGEPEIEKLFLCVDRWRCWETNLRYMSTGIHSSQSFKTYYLCKVF